MIKDVALKITLSFGFILTFLAIILLSKAPASDYELSIYDAIPIHVWFILLLCVVLGIISNINIIFLNANSFYWFISPKPKASLWDRDHDPIGTSWDS